MSKAKKLAAAALVTVAVAATPVVSLAVGAGAVVVPSACAPGGNSGGCAN